MGYLPGAFRVTEQEPPNGIGVEVGGACLRRVDVGMDVVPALPGAPVGRWKEMAGGDGGDPWLNVLKTFHMLGSEGIRSNQMLGVS